MNNRLDSVLLYCKEESWKGHRALIGCSKQFVGYVYLMQAGEYIKIGVARDVQKRLDTLQMGCPFTIEVLCSGQTK